MIPSLNKLLEDEEEDVRWETVKLIGNLAEHGK
jgi:HEAT repeat protein